MARGAATALWAGVIAAACSTGVTRAEPPRALPERVARYLTEVVKPSASEHERLLRGEPFTRLLDTDAGREVAVFGAIWVDAPRHGYREAVLDIERYERGRSFPVTRKLGTPPSLHDFADLRLSEEALRDLGACRVGACKVKLGLEAIEAFRARVDFAAPTARQDAESIFRQQLLEYVGRYRAMGNAGLVEYHDDSPPVRSADEFMALIATWPPLSDSLPELQRFLLEYPSVPWPWATDFLYWQEVRFGLKPFIRVSHFVVHEGASETVVASKMLYASHYFRSALELRVLISDPARERGYWLVTLSRSRPDGLTGFIGRLIRGRVRGEARKGVHDMLVSAKRRLERSATP